MICMLVACLLALAELVTMSLLVAPFAVGALVAAMVVGLGAGLTGSLAFFAVVSLFILFAVRPLVVIQGPVVAHRDGSTADRSL